MKKHIKRALQFEATRFILIGVVNTFLDFFLLNMLLWGTSLTRIQANLISASVAMCFSFYANRTIVFKDSGAGQKRQAALFFAGTAFGTYVLQTIVIKLFTEVWTWPFNTVANFFGMFDHQFIVTNEAKLAATIVTLIWNFWFYKTVVFREKKSE